MKDLSKQAEDDVQDSISPPEEYSPEGTKKLISEQLEIRLSLLHSISTRIVSRMSVEHVIEQAIDQISEYFPDVRVAYSTINQQGTIKVLYSREPPGMPALAGLEADLKSAPSYLNALLQHEPVLVQDVSLDTRMKPLAKAMLAGKTHAVLDVPLVHSQTLVGALWFDASEPRQWTEHELSTLKEIAEYLAFALKDAQAEVDRKQVEEKLVESEQRFRQMAETIHDVFWMTEPASSRAFYISPAMKSFECNLFWFEHFPPERGASQNMSRHDLPQNSSNMNEHI